MRDHAVLRNDDNSIANVIKPVIHLIWLADGADDAILSNARVFIDDRVFNSRVATDADSRNALPFVLENRRGGLVVITAHHDRSRHVTSFAHQTAHADNAVINLRVIDDAAI